MKKRNLILILTLLMSMVGITASALDINENNANENSLKFKEIEVDNADGKTIYYYYMNDDGTQLAVTFRGLIETEYRNEYSGKIVIPEEVTYNGITSKVTYIRNMAFYDCPLLTSITIPNSVTSIGNYAFDEADIPTIISLIENPSAISSNIFSQNTFNNATLYVPVGTIEKYKSTTGWKDFANIVEGTPTAIQTVKQDAATFDGPATIYNVKGELQTAPLEALPHGIYIVNGKTVVK